jgi:hypothetical protein
VKHVLKRAGISQVFIGLQSLDAPPSMDRFKFRMGLTAKPVRQRVVFHPRLRPLINRGSHAIVKQTLSLLTRKTTFAKAEGMIRFYLEGEQPLQAQTLPEELKNQNDEIFQQFY